MLENHRNKRLGEASNQASYLETIMTRSMLLLTPFLILATLLMMGCNARPAVPSDAQLELIEGQINEVTQFDDKTLIINMARSARSFCIHRDYSPDAQALMDKAKAVSGTGATVQAKVWVRDPALSKANPEGSSVPGPPWVIIEIHEVTRQ